MFLKQGIVFIILWLGICLHLYGEHIALRNNLIYDATLTPNLAVDLRTSAHWTTGLGVGFNPFPTDDAQTRKWRHLLVEP